MEKSKDSESVALTIDGQESLTAEQSSRLKHLEDVIETTEESVGKAIGEACSLRSTRVGFIGPNTGRLRSIANRGGVSSELCLSANGFRQGDKGCVDKW
jgi:hypothetical protein